MSRRTPTVLLALTALLGPALVGCSTGSGAGPEAAGPSSTSASASASASASGSAGEASGGPEDDVTYEPTAQDRRDIDQMLRRRADAVLEGDRAAFLATVDDRDDDVVAGQRRLYENLRRLRPDRLDYLLGEVQDGDPVAGDDPVVRLRTVEEVGLDGTLRRPLGQPVRMTYVRRDGGWLVGNETANVRESTAVPEPRPWFGPHPVRVERRGDLVVVADADRPVARLADRAARAVRREARLIGVPADDAVLVVLSDNSRAQFERASAFRGDVEFTGVTRELTAVDDDGRADGRAGLSVQLSPTRFGTRVDDPYIVEHEIAHALTADLITGPVPKWASEGVASWAAAGRDLRSLAIPSRLARPVRRLDDVLPASGTYGQEPLDYLEGWAAVQRLMSRGGPERFLRLLAAFRDLPPVADPSTQRLRRVYGITEAELAREARRLLLTATR